MNVLNALAAFLRSRAAAHYSCSRDSQTACLSTAADVCHYVVTLAFASEWGLRLLSSSWHHSLGARGCSSACRKFTHLIQTATMLLVAAFGSGMDEVDLDKSSPRWNACKPLLAHLFADAAYPKSAAFRELHRDFGAQAALFASLCLWRCQTEMHTCSEQVCEATPGIAGFNSVDVWSW